MNFKENETRDKLRGGYYTDPDIAGFLIRWVLRIRPKTVLEPSCGDGVFFRELSKMGALSVREVVGFEIDGAEARKAREAAESIPGVVADVRKGDFLGWCLLQSMMRPSFDAVVGNPPFIRYQYLDREVQEVAQELFRLQGLPFTRHTNAWVPFVMSSMSLLRPGGRLGMVVPSELLHILHAQGLRGYLSGESSRVVIVDPRELWFENTLQGAMLILAEKKRDRSADFEGLGIVEAYSRDILAEDPEDIFQGAECSDGETSKGKWMRALLSAGEREVFDSVRGMPSVRKFGDVADVVVGIVTGANDFFVVPDEVVRKYGLKRWAYPAFGRSEQVPGVILDEKVFEANRARGLPTNLIWFKGNGSDRLSAGAREYIELGEKLGLHRRFKCRVREPWFSVPSVYSTGVGLLKRSHDFPRLVLNKIGAYSTDTAYRVSPKKVGSAALVWSFVNSLTSLSAELEGRHYGGGVLELVPSEIRKLVVPFWEGRRPALRRLDQMFREGLRPEDVLAQQDSLVLAGVGVGKRERGVLLDAWLRLRGRRQRNAEGGSWIK